MLYRARSILVLEAIRQAPRGYEGQLLPTACEQGRQHRRYHSGRQIATGSFSIGLRQVTLNNLERQAIQTPSTRQA
jgi:hypothetical protein